MEELVDTVEHKSKFRFKPVVKYNWIIGHLPFFLFLSTLAVIYISNVHWAQGTVREISETSNQVKNLQYEYKSLKGKEMKRTREAEILKAAEPLGLQQPTETPKVIIIKK